MKKIRVSLGERSYDIHVGSQLLSLAGAIIRKLGIGKDALVISNGTVAGLHYKKIESSLRKSGISSKLEIVPDSETAKSQKTLMLLLNRIGAYDKNRTLFLVCLGGGVVGDLAGFAASIYKRGVPYIQIPTTLLAQVDSAIGGKVAIDLPAAKNLIGAFYQPKVVLSDTLALKSLHLRQIRSGLAECIKYGVISDRHLFEYIENNHRRITALESSAIEHIVISSSRIKARIVAEDEFDRTGKRAILNYGHTIGHAIEAASCYSNKYNHGEAIAVGMVIAAHISSKLGFLKDNDRARIESLVRSCGLPAVIKGIKLSSIYNAHLHDKKFIHGKNRFVLPTGIGSVRIVEGVPDQVIISSIKDYMG